MCGYPSAGEAGYGTQLGQRVAAFSLVDCELETVDFADFFCPREDDYGDYNKAILLTIGAGWCEPCVEETSELMTEVYEPLHAEGLEIVQVMIEDGQAMPPTSSFCQAWRDEAFDPPLAFPILLDQTFVWAEPWLDDPLTGLPISLLVDANANIRWKVEGQNPPDTRAQAQAVMAEPYGP